MAAACRMGHVSGPHRCSQSRGQHANAVPMEDAEETAQRVRQSRRDPRAGAAAAEGDEMMERIATVLWQAMDQVPRVCQMATKELGHFLRTEAIRTEKHQTRYTPLLAYMNEESIREHVRPWQPIIMFFSRTQRGVWSGGKRPRYGFTPRQRKTWQCLWECAAGPVERERPREEGRRPHLATDSLGQLPSEVC